MILKWLKLQSTLVKSSKYYFFEFILIFVAVAAGAWVENLREDFQTRDKENRLMYSLVEDLQMDTTEIGAQIKALKARLSGMDSIVDEIYSKDAKFLDVTKLQRLQYNYVLPVAIVGNNDRTKTQIESIGHDIISNEKIITNVLDYWDLKKDLSFNNIRYQDYWWESRKLAYQLFDSRYIFRVNGVLGVLPEAKFLPHTESQIIQYSNWVSNMQGLLEGVYIPNLEKQSKSATELIMLITEEYN